MNVNDRLHRSVERDMNLSLKRAIDRKMIRVTMFAEGGIDVSKYRSHLHCS